MTVTQPTGTALYAALSEQVYNRDGTDQAFTDQDLFGSGNAGFSGVDVAGLIKTDDGYYYNKDTSDPGDLGNGFAARVVKQGEKYIITFRGTDLAGELIDIAAGQLGWTDETPGTSVVDNRDFDTNFALGAGEFGPTQLDDALRLVDAILAQEGVGPEDVVVTGQSLGGGLAGLVTALRGVEGHAFAPAPFKKQLNIEAQKAAVHFVSETSTTLGGFAEAFNTDFFNLTIEEQAAVLATLDQGDPVIPNAVKYLVSGFQSQAVEIKNAFLNNVAEWEAIFSSNTANLTVNSIAGEALSAGILGAILDLGAEHFKDPTTSYDFGEGSDVSLNASVSLHHPSLHALAALTHDSASLNFATLLKDNKNLRDALLEESGIAGAVEKGRADIPDVSSKLASGGPNPAVLYRALWKSFTDSEDKLYNNVYVFFNQTIKSGAAAEGFGSDYTELNITNGITKLALGVLRSAVVNTDELSDVKDNLDGNWDFAGVKANGEPETDRVIIDLSKIIDVNVVFGGDQIHHGDDDKAHGVLEINTALWEKTSESISGMSNTLIGTEFAKLIFGATLNEIRSGDKSIPDWEMLVVQAGDDNGTLDYTAASEDSAKSHVIFGGDGVDKIGGSTANDYVVGGDGDDEFEKFGGNDLYLGGKGNDTYTAHNITDGITFVGGRDKDTAIYGEEFDGSQISIDVANLPIHGFLKGVTVSVTPDGGGAPVVDTLIKVERIELGVGDENVTVSDAAQKQPLTILFSSGESTIQRIKETNPDAPGDDLEKGGLLQLHFELEESTEAFTQHLFTADDFEEEERPDAIIVVDGKQLVGGAAFDFNKFEMRTGDFDLFSPLLQDREYGPVETLDVYQAARAAAIAALFDQASNLAGANPILPGLGAPGIGIGLGLFFGSLGLNEAMRWDTEWVSAYEQVILGWHGERYILSSGPSDEPRRLTIILDADDTQARQEIVIDNWMQGDFGIRIEEFEHGQGLETGTNKNGVFDQTDLTDAEIQAQLAALGFSAPPPPDPGGAAATLQTEPGLIRQGNDANNELGGGDGNDLLRGAEGDDELIGQEGYDTYVFAAGDGHDIIYDASEEGGRIQFLEGVDLAAVTQVEVDDGNGGTNLLITYGNGDTITIVGWSSLSQATKDAWVLEVLDGPVISAADPALTPDTSVRPSELIGTSGDDVIEGGDQSEILDGLGGNDVLRGNGGDDQVLGGDDDDTVSGGDGNDRIVAGDGDDIIRGGRGDDEIDGGWGNDVYFFDLGDGADTISNQDGGTLFLSPSDTDRIVFGEGISVSDIRFERSLDDTRSITLKIGEGDDEVHLINQYGASGFLPIGFDGIDEFEFQDGTLWSREDVLELYLATSSTDGDDTIVGFDHLDDVIAGGAGNDTLSGGAGSDTYLWNRGDGDDLIVDIADASLYDDNVDALILGAGITAADVAVSRPAGSFDLVLTIAGTDGGQITVFDLFRESSEPFTDGVEFVRFSDGTAWDKQTLYNLSMQNVASDGDDTISGSPGADVIDGGLGNDFIRGASGDDTLIGGQGDDYLRGDWGNDTYIFGTSFGKDTIYDGGSSFDSAVSDRVVFTDYSLSDFTFRLSGSDDGDLIMDRVGSDDSLLVNLFTHVVGRIETYEFADGVEVSWEQIRDLAEISVFAPNPTNGTENADTLDGTDLGDRLLGQGGNDQLNMGAGNDIGYGGDGADTINAGAGRDALIGDDGNDILNAGEGDDIAFGGAGEDTISGDAGDDFIDGGLQNDTLDGGAGNDELRGSAGDDDLTGGAGDDELYGGLGNDDLTGGTGNDVLLGGAGNDIYRFERGDGQDTIRSHIGREDGDIKTLVLGAGLTQENIRFEVFGGYLGNPSLRIFFANGTTDSITVERFTKGGVLDRIVFSDGSELNASQILEQATRSTGGDDSPAPNAEVAVSGSAFVTYGGRGNDVLNSGGTRDIFVFGRGDGNDVINVDSNEWSALHLRDYTPAEVVLTRTGTGQNDLTIAFVGSDDSVTIANHFGGNGINQDNSLGEIVFQNGTVWNAETISNNSLQGASTSGDDDLVGGSINSPDERFEGGLGDDSLSGGSGSDTYVYALGDGSDTVIDAGTDGGDTDRIELGSGLNPDNVTVLRSQSNPNDIVLSMPDGGQILLVNQLGGDASGVEQVLFLNGTIWTRTELASLAANGDATGGNDVIQGSDQAETLDGGTGDDTLIGGDGGDTYRYSLGDGSDQIVEAATSGEDRLQFDGSVLPDDVTLSRDPADPDTLLIDLGNGDVITVQDHFVDGTGLELIVFDDGTKWNRDAIQAKAILGSSTAGNDVLVGTSSDDVIAGAEGNDTLDGGEGSDLYLFRIGDGQDVIQDSGSVEGTDRLAFGEGIDESMVDISRAGDDLVVSLRDTADSITVSNYFLPGQASVGAVEFLDGTIWDAAEIVARANNAAPTVDGGIAAQSVAQDAAFSFAIPADAFNDSDAGDTLTYTASLADGSVLPDWLTFDGMSFSGTPANSDVGSISIRITAIDGAGDRQSTDFVLDVTNVNDAPVAADVLPNQAVAIGGSFSYTVPEDTFSDPDAQIPGGTQPDLTYSAELEDGSALPSWLSFDSATRSFTGTPPAGSDGALSVRVIASDGQATGSVLLGIAVGGGNAAPTVLTPIAAQQANEEATFVFAIPNDAFADATPGDHLTYSAELQGGGALPGWLSFDARTGTFKGVPTNDDVGTLSIAVTATDVYNETATSVFVLNIADVNDAPTGPGSLESFVAQEEALFEYVIPSDAFQDIDQGDTLTLTAEQADGRPLPDWLTFENGVFSGTPDDQDISVHNIVVTATDSAGASVSADFFLFVEPINDAPEAAAPLPSITVDRFEDFTYDLPFDAFQDVDDLGLSFSASSADGSDLPHWLEFDPLTGRFSGDPGSLSVGTHEGSRTYQIKVTATDAAGATAESILEIVVQAPYPGETLDGTSGNDVIDGTAGPDTITGGAGDDELTGNEGRDTFIFGPGFGQDVIDRSSNDSGNRIVFEAGIAPQDVQLSRAGSTIVFRDADYYAPDLLISIAGSSDQITVKWQFDGLVDDLPVVSEIEFSDGTIWTAEFITSQLLVTTTGDDILAGDGYDNVINGDAGSDELFGLDGNDILNGGAGDDILYGGEDDDTYIFEIGTGSDLIVDEAFAVQYSFDTLQFGAGITPEDLIFTRDFDDPRVPGEQSFENENNLRIEYAPTGDNVVILYQYEFKDDRTGGIERFEFADGTVFTLEEFDRLVSPDGLLSGTDGDDELQGTSLSETLVGGLGDDTLDGGLGDDTYQWSLGDGNDSIEEHDIISFDILEFGTGIRPEDVVISRPINPSGGQVFDLYFDILPTGERITVESGVVADVSETGEFEKPIDEVRFEDGTVWSFSYIASTFLQGTSGDDVLLGYDPLIDLLDGGAGNDELRGLGGSDTYVFGLGYGTDTVFDAQGSFYIFFPVDARDFVRFNEGILPSDIEISRSVELIEGELQTFTDLTISGTQDTLRLTGDVDYILEVFFRETETTWTLDDLKEIYFSQNNTEGDDTLLGFGDGRTIVAGAGNDTLVAQYEEFQGREWDVLIGGDGNDTYEVGSGARFVNIEDQGQTGDFDVLIFNQDFQSSFDVPDDVSFRRAENGQDLHIWDTYAYGAPSVVLRNFFRGPEFTVEEIRFDDGTILTIADILARTTASPVESNIVTGTASAETVTGVSFTAETIDGGAGDDTLIGGDGESDVYLWGTGDGNDTIVEGIGSGSFNGLDVVKFEDVNSSDVTLLRSGLDLQIRIDSTSEILTVQDHFNAASNSKYAGIEEIAFANGEIWRKDFIDSQALIEGTDGNDTLSGTNDDDRFLGRAGDDVINSNVGNDTFVYRSGDGSDTINETGNSSGTDTLEFADINAPGVQLSRLGDDLIVLIEATGDTITFNDQFSGSSRGIEQIVFADGTVWDRSRIDNEAWIRGTSGDDTLDGSSDDEILSGQGGNDLLSGGSGNDTYIFNLGDGQDTISESTGGFNTDNDTVQFGENIAPGDVTLTRENAGMDLVIAINGTTDKITVSDQFATDISGIEKIAFVDGTVWSRDELVSLSNPATGGDDTLVGDETDNIMSGGAGHDTINGLGGEDSITGGLGDDVLAGGDGSDSYFYSRGDGNDTINDGGSDGEIIDRLYFAADILPSDVSVERSADGQDFILTIIDTGETITLEDRLIAATGGVDEVVFDDGTHWDFIALENLAALNNTAPLAVADSGFSTDEDTLVTILASALLANDTDADNDTLTILSVQDAVNGSVLLNAQGDVEFTPAADYNGPASFTYTVSDGNGGTSTATVDLTVNAVNDDPVANADSGFSTDEDTLVTILASALLANDTDADNDTLTILSVQDAVNGSVVLNAQGDVEFTPAADYNGPASFTYTVSDGNGGTSTATVDLTVNAVNDDPVANADSGFSTNEDTLVTILASALLANDTDADNDTLTILSVQDAVNGTVVLNAQGDVEFTPAADYNGPASFTYTVSDGNGGTSTATVDLTVNAVNDDPVAVADSGFTTDEDTLVTILASALLANDTDADNDTLTILSVQDAVNGSVVLNAQGDVEFTPAADYNGPASFTYTVSDGNGGTSTATVDLTVNAVNDDPVAVADSGFTTDEDTLVTILASALLANDTDADNDMLTILSVQDAVNGSVVLNAQGDVEFTPAADYNGPASFTYTVSDGNGGTSTATVDLTVNAVNDDPVANADSGFTTDEDTLVTILASALLANDADADNDTLTILSVQDAVNGTVVLNAQGDVEFTPAADYDGPASFTYTVSDGNGGTSTATVNLTVNAVVPGNTAPVAVGDSGFSTDEDTLVTILASALLANDTDADNDTLTILSVQDAVNGSVLLNAQGDVEFTPAADYNGPASFTYTVSDGNGGTSTATVDLTVNAVNDDPVAVADSGFTTDEDTLVTILASALLANDTDADNDTLTILSVQDAVNGTVVLNAQGDVEFTPAADYNGAASFTYTVSDGNGGTSTATVDLTVNAVNDDPVANADSGFSTDEDALVTILASALLANDTDADNDTLTILSVQDAVNGTVVLNAQGDVEFTPAADYNGAASFTYTVSDGNGGTSTATVDLTVNAVNDDPVANADSGFSTNEDTLVTILASALLANDTDADNDTLTILSVQDAVNGTAVLNAQGDVEFTPAADYNGPASFTYTVSDGNGGTSTATVDLTVNAVNPNLILGTSGDDTLTGTGENETLQGLGGNDTLEGGLGSDTYIYNLGDGDDVIFDNGISSNTDRLTLGNGLNAVDVVLTRSTTDDDDVTLTFTGVAGSIVLDEQFRNTSGAYGIEEIVFGDGTVWSARDLEDAYLNQVSTDGDDVILGFGGDETLEGGLGNDTLEGGVGSDTYVYNPGDGDDVILDNGIAANTDRLILGTGLNAADVVLTRSTTDDDDVTLTFTGVAGSIVLDEQFRNTSGAYGIEEIVFGDGTVWSARDLEDAYLNQVSTDGDDDILGFGGDETLAGGLGNDTLEGGVGSDTYIYNLGDGDDVILDNGLSANTDRLILGTGLNAADVVLTRSTTDDDDVTLTFTGIAGSIVLDEQFRNTSGAYGIEEIVFGDGTVWSARDLEDAYLNQASTDGDDDIIGFDRDDTIEGGLGNDTLEGGNGGDTYVYTAGDGDDVILDNSFDALADTLRLHNIAVADVTLTSSGVDPDDVILSFAGGGSVILDEQFSAIGSSNDRIENVEFDDGTIWTWTDIEDMLLGTNVITGTSASETLNGTASADVLQGLAGDDTLNGNDGSDVYLYASGDGNDLINDDAFANTTDTLEFTDLNVGDLTFSRKLSNSNDLLITIDATGETIDVDDQFRSGDYGLEQIEFADGTVWDEATIEMNAWFRGTAAGETITASAGDDVIIGNGGDDTLRGTAGSDTYRYASGDGNDIVDEASQVGTDRLLLTDLNIADLTFTRVVSNTNDLEILVNATGETIDVDDQFRSGDYGLEQIEFADGTIWDEAMIEMNAWYRGTAAGETITGTSGDNVIIGNGGDDTLRGAAGNDVYIYASGDGTDFLDDQSDDTSTDRLVFSDLNIADLTFARNISNTNDLLITVNATGAVITSDDQFYGGNWGLEEIEFADGTIWNRATILDNAWFRGTAAGETITGTSGDNVIIGNGGDDTLRGAAGNDVYFYASGDGTDFLDDQSDDTSTDRLVFSDLNIADLTFARNFNNSNDLLITDNATGAVITSDDQFYGGNWGLEEIEFADGTIWNRATILANSWFRGTDGDDSMNIAGGDDTFVGGLGNDNIRSTTGSDTFIYATGDGNDRIDEENGSTTYVDTLKLTDLNQADIELSTVGNDLFLTDLTTGQLIEIDEQFYSTSANYGIEVIEFADGTTWDRATIKANAWIRGTDANDSIDVAGGDDTFFGGLGDDNIRSTTGSDTFIYASGDGNDRIDEENASTTYVDTLKLTDLNQADIELSKLGNDLFLTDLTTGHLIEIDEQYYSTSSNYGIEVIEFADGTSRDRATINALGEATTLILGTSADETLNGSAGDEIIYGYEGADTLGAGAGDDVLIGGLGADTLEGGEGADTYIYNAGDGADLINDWGDPADNDALHLGAGLLSTNVAVERGSASIWDMVLDFGAGDQITAQGHFGSNMQFIEQVKFADGTVWSEEDLRLTYLSQHSTSGDDTIDGFFVDDVIDAGAGNDAVYAYDGDDTITGGTGNDYLEGLQGADTYIFNVGDGSDLIQEWSDPTAAPDAIEFGSGITTGMISIDRASDGFFDLVLTIGVGGDEIRVVNQFQDDWETIEQFRFNDATVWTADDVKANYLADQTTSGDDTINGFFGNDVIEGGAGADSLYGSDGDDRLIGGAGDDYMEGESGDDTIVLASGEGFDWVGGFEAGAGSDDVIEIDGITGFTQFSHVIAAATEINGDTHIDFDASNGVALAGVSLASLHEDDFRFV